MKEVKLQDICYHHNHNSGSGIQNNSKPEPSLSLHFDDGLAYGLGFFETILLTEVPHLLVAHVKRINHSLQQFQLGRYITAETVASVIQHYGLHHCALRLQITEKNAFITTRPLSHTYANRYNRLSLTVSPVRKSSTSPLIQHKSCNYGENLLSLRAAKPQGYDDCLFLNENGYLTESSVANIFIIHKGKLYTPPVEDGLLPGVLRKELIKHYPVEEKHLTLHDLLHGEGAFLTNSLMGIKGITMIDGTALDSHPLIKEIIEWHYRTFVAADAFWHS